MARAARLSGVPHVFIIMYPYMYASGSHSAAVWLHGGSTLHASRSLWYIKEAGAVQLVPNGSAAGANVCSTCSPQQVEAQAFLRAAVLSRFLRLAANDCSVLLPALACH